MKQYCIIIDTTSSIASVIVGSVNNNHGPKYILRQVNAGRPKHSKLLLNDILSCLRQYLKNENYSLAIMKNIPPKFIAVAIGPGSFTGLRLGLMTVKTLCQFIPCPLLSYTSLLLHHNILAEKYFKNDENMQLHVMYDAKRKSCYCVSGINGIIDKNPEEYIFEKFSKKNNILLTDDRQAIEKYFSRNKLEYYFKDIFEIKDFFYPQLITGKLWDRNNFTSPLEIKPNYYRHINISKK